MDNGSQSYGSIMGGENEQANLRSQSTNQNLPIVRSIRKVDGRDRNRYQDRFEPNSNTSAFNEVDTNAETCCLGQNFIPLTYGNRTTDIYP